jgi:hypothetical protein
VGWADDKKRHERRKGRLVNPNLPKTLGEPYLVVEGLPQLSVFLALGGRALVEQATAEKWLSDIVGEDVAVPDGSGGFKSPGLVPECAFKYAPTPKLRMQVLKRDHMRCRICGRGPEHSTDVQLRVHHIRPFARGGVTEEKNLITLCHTCHDGLDPHFEPSLYRYTDPLDLKSDRQELQDGITRYRTLVSQIIESERQDAPESPPG